MHCVSNAVHVNLHLTALLFSSIMRKVSSTIDQLLEHVFASSSSKGGERTWQTVLDSNLAITAW
jgi:hypothetical protein